MSQPTNKHWRTSGATALLVDDNDELRSATQEQLEELGFSVIAAADAEQALRVVQEMSPGKDFDLLVSDVYMPGLNGVELADRLLSRQPELAILLISSRGGESEVRRRLALGDIAFLAKPFASSELTAKVGEAFDRVTERRGGAPSEPSPEVTVPWQGPAPARHGLPKWAAQVAAVVLLVLAIGAVVRSLEHGAPPLPAPTQSPTRSTTIEIVQPLGPLAAAPAELVWLPIDGASSYTVSLRSIDGSALWQTEVTGPTAAVPVDVESGLHRAVTYYWSVEARDAQRRLLGRSELAPFVIELTSQP